MRLIHNPPLGQPPPGPPHRRIAAETGQRTPSAREIDTMIMTRQLQSTIRVLLATIAVAALALVAVAVAAPAQAAGLRNCTEISGGFARAGCWEDVWASGAEYRMTFATGCCSQFKGRVPDDLDNFYVMAPQDDTPQSLNAPFRHDHVVRDLPAQNHGNYSVRLHGFFVLCSPEAMASGACVFEMNSPFPGLTLPFAKTVNGQSLTSVEPLEAAVDAGLITLVDTGAVIVGTINQTR
jgi:hypothetical protein